MPQEVMTLSVDTGSVLINVDDKGEVIGQFRFNPSDLDILRRYEAVVDAMNGYRKVSGCCTFEQRLRKIIAILYPAG